MHTGNMSLVASSSIASSSTIAPAAKKSRPRKRTDQDNPFKGTGLTDDDVCDLPFNDLIKIMKEKNFTADMIERGKKHRKRLKNRKQVMSYANRKKTSNNVTQMQNVQLEESIQALNRENSSLALQNKKLDQVVRSRNMQSEAIASANALMMQQIEALKRQLDQMTNPTTTLK